MLCRRELSAAALQIRGAVLREIAFASVHRHRLARVTRYRTSMQPPLGIIENPLGMRLKRVIAADRLLSLLHRTQRGHCQRHIPIAETIGGMQRNRRGFDLKPFGEFSRSQPGGTRGPHPQESNTTLATQSAFR